MSAIAVAQKAGLSLASVLLCCTAMEVILRLTGYGKVGYQRGDVVRHRGGEFDHTAVVNSLMLRDAEVGPRPEGELRILALGDSFTYGLGVEEPDTFVRRTERDLRDRARSCRLERTIRIVNGGVGGGPYLQGKWLEDLGLGLEPNFVLETFYIGNDLYDDLAWRRNGAAAADPPAPQWWEAGSGPAKRAAEPITRRVSVQKNVLFLDWIWAHIVMIPLGDKVLFKLGLRYNERPQFQVDQPELERSAWSATLGKIGETEERLRERGIQYFVMIVPTADQVRYGPHRRPGEDYRLPNRILTNFLSARGIPHLDLLPLIEQDPDRDTFYYSRDLHWTRHGHRFAAGVLAERLWPLVAETARLAGASGP